MSEKTVDAYLDSVASEEARKTLAHLRDVIRAAIPDAEEVISYGIPTYKLNGFVASFGAYKNHLSFFPGHTVADFAEELNGFKLQKGTIQFKADKPIPDALVTAIVQARAKENRA